MLLRRALSSVQLVMSVSFICRRCENDGPSHAFASPVFGGGSGGGVVLDADDSRILLIGETRCWPLTPSVGSSSSSVSSGSKDNIFGVGVCAGSSSGSVAAVNCGGGCFLLDEDRVSLLNSVR